MKVDARTAAEKLSDRVAGVAAVVIIIDVDANDMDIGYMGPPDLLPHVLSRALVGYGEKGRAAEQAALVAAESAAKAGAS